MQEIKKFEPLWGVWEIDSIIGEGSFGKVYKAVRKDFDKEYFCAIKHVSVPQSENEIKQFFNENGVSDESSASEYFHHIVKDVTDEISIMYSLKGNSNIVSYEEHLVVEKESGIGYDIFIKMELLSDLSEKSKTETMTQSDVIKLGIDIGTALEVCVEKKLIHRDIKPQNIFVSEEGRYKLGDFGISRKLEKTVSALSQKGTYSYMAPEVYKGDEYGANVDVYSLGLVLYRLVNGNRLPFFPLAPTPIRYDDNEKALLRRMKAEELPKPAFASAKLWTVIKKMCAFDKKERYKNASDMKNALLTIEGEDNQVVSMIAPVGKVSLTLEETEKALPNEKVVDNELDKTEGTVGMFGKVPTEAELESSESENGKTETAVEIDDPIDTSDDSVAKTEEDDKHIIGIGNKKVSGFNKNKKKIFLIGGGSLAVLVAVIIAIIIMLTPKPWSEWVEELPSNVNENAFNIKTKSENLDVKEYQFRTKKSGMDTETEWVDKYIKGAKTKITGESKMEYLCIRWATNTGMYGYEYWTPDGYYNSDVYGEAPGIKEEQWFSSIAQLKDSWTYAGKSREVGNKQTLYQKVTKKPYPWSKWSDWQETKVEKSDDCEVKTRDINKNVTFYQYQQK